MNHELSIKTVTFRAIGVGIRFQSRQNPNEKLLDLKLVACAGILRMVLGSRTYYESHHQDSADARRDTHPHIQLWVEARNEISFFLLQAEDSFLKEAADT